MKEDFKPKEGDIIYRVTKEGLYIRGIARTISYHAKGSIPGTNINRFEALESYPKITFAGDIYGLGLSKYTYISEADYLEMIKPDKVLSSKINQHLKTILS